MVTAVLNFFVLYIFPGVGVTFCYGDTKWLKNDSFAWKIFCQFRTLTLVRVFFFLSALIFLPEVKHSDLSKLILYLLVVLASCITPSQSSDKIFSLITSCTTYKNKTFDSYNCPKFRIFPRLWGTIFVGLHSIILKKRKWGTFCKILNFTYWCPGHFSAKCIFLVCRS